MHTTSTYPETAVVDAADIKARFDEDPDLMREIIDLFLTDYRERLTALQAALDRNDAGDLCLQAHSLKGSAGAIGASQVAASAATLESLARAGALADAGPACQAVRQQLDRIAPLLGALLAADPRDVAAA
ncbi:Hpt domain-containing protein [Candidatus Binatia bacterium]|nr:Hpt domain-containing protein [Candidatus Binatia bacterium]